MYCHLELLKGGAGGRLGTTLCGGFREPVWGAGCPGGAGRGSRFPAQLAPISQRAVGLDLRIIQGQQEVGKRRQSKNSSWCRGLATQELGFLNICLSLASWAGVK